MLGPLRFQQRPTSVKVDMGGVCTERAGPREVIQGLLEIPADPVQLSPLKMELGIHRRGGDGPVELPQARIDGGMGARRRTQAQQQAAGAGPRPAAEEPGAAS